MDHLASFARSLQRHLRLEIPPLGIAFPDRPPEGVPHAQALPASCSYWRRAAEGHVFWTDAADHQGCPIGAHTHAAPLEECRKAELVGLVGNLVQLGYLKEQEVAALPRRAAPLRVAVYGPLDRLCIAPEVVLVRGTAAQLMLLVEAAQAAGVGPEGPALGRPTCAALPQAIESARPVVSLGCIGNRVYTGLSDGEGYVVLPAPALARVVDRLGVLAHANAELEKFHRARAGSAGQID